MQADRVKFSRQEDAVLLSAIKVNVQKIAERTIPDDVMLLAAEEVVKEIEKLDYKIRNKAIVLIAADGSSLYSSMVGVNRHRTTAIYFVTTDGVPTRLVEMDLVPPTSSQAADKVLYYDWYGINTIQINASPTTGNLRFEVSGLPNPLVISTDVSYAPMQSGVLSWLSDNMWGDTRGPAWKTAYESQKEALLKQTLFQGSRLNND